MRQTAARTRRHPARAQNIVTSTGWLSHAPTTPRAFCFHLYCAHLHPTLLSNFSTLSLFFPSLRLLPHLPSLPGLVPWTGRFGWLVVTCWVIMPSCYSSHTHGLSSFSHPSASVSLLLSDHSPSLLSSPLHENYSPSMHTASLHPHTQTCSF